MQSMDFISIIKNIAEEQSKSLEDLFKNKIVSKNTFYKYKQRKPSLKTLMNVCNYLEVSIDYMLELTTENKFVRYEYSCELFYKNIITYLKVMKLSGRKFCDDLNYSRDNLIRWKSGTMPSVQILLEITKYFNCLIDDLILR